MEDIPTSRVNKVKNIPKLIFSHFVPDALRNMFKKIITAGIDKINVAANNFTGLPSIFSPFKRPSVFPEFAGRQNE